tara:strand:+ start:280 stop:441 length:162 start_codon:yes stop_codon:yes gene_type:complete
LNLKIRNGKNSFTHLAALLSAISKDCYERVMDKNLLSLMPQRRLEVKEILIIH